MPTIAQTLDRAVRHHRAGDLVQAQQLYSQILREEPQNADALHLLGLIAGQFGRQDLAVTLILQALRLKPDFADAHNNLGNALRALNKLDEAAASYRQALGFKPNHWEAHNNLGNVLHEQGKLSEAAPHLREVIRLKHDFVSAHHTLGEVLHKQAKLEEAAASFRQALRLQPNHAAAHNNLGNVLLDLGKLDEAAVSYEEALRLRPELAEVHSNLGFVYRCQGKVGEAIDSCRNALRLEPNLAEAHVNLANALLDQDKVEEAILSFRQALRLKPNLAGAHNNLGIALRKIGRLDEAIARVQEALRLQPDYAEAHSNLGNILRVHGRLDRAAASCQEAIRLKPDLADAHNNLGNVLQTDGKLDDALASFREALRLQPDSAATHNNLGVALLAQGKLDQALVHIHEALRLAPGDPVALHQLGRLARDRKYQLNADEVNEVRASLAQPTGGAKKKVLLNFTLAYLAEQNGDYDLAFEHYLQGNNCKRQAPELWSGFNCQDVRDDVDASIATFQRALFARMTAVGHPSETPVFIVGMPRSGTTLVEQILSSHPRFAGAGELTEIGAIASDLPKDADRYPQCTTGLCQATIRDLAERYLKRLQRDDGEALRVSDKMPLNFLHLGLIAVLFPRARVIHCRRDPRDTCISCFCENFESVPFATSLEDVGLYYRQYARLMVHWREVLPLPMLDVFYEDLVKEPETVIRQAVEFCELDWDDRCLRFHQTRRTVQTASNLQVRQPIYARSVGRWERYRAHVGRLIELLQPYLANPR